MTRAVAVTAAALLVGPVAPAATARPTYSQTYIASADGTLLHAEVFRPAVRGRVPVVLLVTPYGNEVRPVDVREPGALLYREFETLLDKGYAVVQVSLRGFGASGGCGDMGGPGEQADVKASVEWAASRSWSNGRVGMWGLSYDAWTQVMALATKPRGLAAVLIQSPLVSLYSGLFMNRAHYNTIWHVTPTWYGTNDLAASGPTDPTDAPCYAENNIETANPDPATAYWKERDLVARARTSQVPVLWSHGFRDMNTKPDNLTALYPLLRGPKRAWVGQFWHSTPYDQEAPGVAALYQREAFDWLDAYVKRDPAALRRVAGQSRAVVQQQDTTWRRDDSWPPRDARQATFGLRAGGFVDDHGAARGTVDSVHWTFSQRLPYAVHLSGAPRVTLSARGATPAQVVVLVYDVGPEGEARVVTRGAHAFVDGRVSFELYPQDWRFERGHRIAVAMQGNDATFWSPSPANGAVTIDAPSIALPVLRFDRRAEPILVSKGAAPRPTAYLGAAVIAAGELAFRLPPPMRRR